MLRAGWRSRGSARLLAAGTPALAVAFVAVEHYGRNYWLYRGFPPPTDPAYVTQTGTQEQLAVESAALGGRAQQVDVYLPPGYAEHPERRYPVMYLLHGFPGRPLAFLLPVRAGLALDEPRPDRQQERERSTREAVEQVHHGVAQLRVVRVARRQIDIDLLGPTAERRTFDR